MDDINYGGVFIWKASMLAEIFCSEEWSKFGYFWLKTDHGPVDHDIVHTLKNFVMIFYLNM